MKRCIGCNNYSQVDETNECYSCQRARWVIEGQEHGANSTDMQAFLCDLFIAISHQTAEVN